MIFGLRSFNLRLSTVTACACLASTLGVMFLVSIFSIMTVRSALVEEFRRAGKQKIELFGQSIEQDVANGFYPSVVQQADRFMRDSGLTSLRIVISGNDPIFFKNMQKSSTSDLEINYDVFLPRDGSDGKTKPIASVEARVDMQPIDSSLGKIVIAESIALAIASIVVIFLVFLVTRIVTKPIADLQTMASSRNLARLSGDPVKATFIGIREVIDLRHELGRLASESIRVHELERESSKANAIAQTTQMLAHDVRKPFSILRMGLGVLGNAKDPAAVKNVLSRLVPEIDKAVSSVDGLIADVMEMGSSSTELIQEPISAESLIESTLGEIFRVYPKADVTASYDLQHVHMANVHVQKVGRVFSNVVGNAIQAMKYKGHIWFKTRENAGFIEFCLGNAGSVIPPESLTRLFDAFFTSGKKGGTGLGLAIAQKVVTAHGGKIWCESSRTIEHPAGKVEFFFTLPIAVGERSKTTARLPMHSSEITRGLLSLMEAGREGSLDKGEITLEADIIQARERSGRPLRVLLVDDEQVYKSALAAYLGRTAELEQALHVTQASNSSEALSSADAEAFDLIITDVDMGPDSQDGFELVQELRKRGLCGLICIHSNRIVSADHKTATQAGADAFLPKPMARAQLLRLVLQAAPTASAKSEKKSVLKIALSSPTPAKPEILVVDDNAFILGAWEAVLSTDAKVYTATSLASLERLLANDPGLVSRLTLAVTDFHLDDGVADGADIGRTLKQHRLNLEVLLSSDGVYDLKDFGGAIDRVISKNPAPLKALMNFAYGAESALH